jgi:hypothetical protein
VNMAFASVGSSALAAAAGGGSAAFGRCVSVPALPVLADQQAGGASAGALRPVSPSLAPSHSAAFAGVVTPGMLSLPPLAPSNPSALLTPKGEGFTYHRRVVSSSSCCSPWGPATTPPPPRPPAPRGGAGLGGVGGAAQLQSIVLPSGVRLTPLNLPHSHVQQLQLLQQQQQQDGDTRMSPPGHHGLTGQHLQQQAWQAAAAGGVPIRSPSMPSLAVAGDGATAAAWPAPAGSFPPLASLGISSTPAGAAAHPPPTQIPSAGSAATGFPRVQSSPIPLHAAANPLPPAAQPTGQPAAIQQAAAGAGSDAAVAAAAGGGAPAGGLASAGGSGIVLCPEDVENDLLFMDVDVPVGRMLAGYNDPAGRP